MPPTPFLSTLAVETWDTWFRLRERGQLRDITIEATWERVANALAAATPRAPRVGYQHRLLDAFSAWNLLLDERIIATAGSSAPNWSGDALCAVLNVASFVRAPGLRHASFDHARFEEVAALAVYALEDAGAMCTGGSDPAGRLKIGMIGLGDALALLGLEYDSEAARRRAAHIAQTLADGCLASSIALARDRTPRLICDRAWHDQAVARSHAHALTDAAMRYGLRHASLTAITSQQRLACFANRVADALDPLSERACSHALCRAPDARKAEGYAFAIARQNGADSSRFLPDPYHSVRAQLALRAAVQPWIDERITYPVVVEDRPDAATVASWGAMATELDLAPLSWRLLSESCIKESAAPAVSTVLA